ncbi:recombinase family protein [Micromonospora endolithica]|uniref:Resolvase n=1 Tax=Micromonospora endolithica TaxID=230091 RepID=A0A3A9YV43_9ACTN|nr:recombinase family protein [Micromonospora endolithica]RKN39981.1 resolvase [Micromonospora endolithica]TWJ26152.1 recombinase [Micromonospora endolithica]
MSGIPMIGYRRVSTEEQAEDGNGMDAQGYAIQQEGDRNGWDLTWFGDPGYSAKDTNRPDLRRALAALDKREYAGMVVAKLDRLSRSVIDFATMVERAQKRKWNLVVLDPRFDLSTPYGRAFAGMAAVWAQLERELIGQRTSEGLQALKRQGVRLGRPRQYSADVVALVATLADVEGMGCRAIAAELSRRAVPTVGGRDWHPSTVRRLLSGHRLDLVAASALEASQSQTAASQTKEEG